MHDQSSFLSVNYRLRYTNIISKNVKLSTDGITK